jgi:hypothetical protein
MTVQTTCPACGAPLEYAGEQDVVVCGFCNTELKVLQEDDDVRFQVLAQPKSEKEVLSRLVDPVSEGNLSGEQPAERMAEPFGLGTPDQEPFFSPPPPVSSTPYQGTVSEGGAQVLQASTPARSSLGGLPKWAVIIIGIVLVLCLLCVCGVAASVFIFNTSSSGF